MLIGTKWTALGLCLGSFRALRRPLRSIPFSPSLLASRTIASIDDATDLRRDVPELLIKESDLARK